MASDLTHLVKIQLPDDLSEEFETACDAAGIAGVTSWGRLGEDIADVAVYFDDLMMAEAALPVLQGIIADIGADEDIVCQIDAIEVEDWQNSWKKFFKAAKVSDRVVVRPSWEEWDGDESFVDVVIDPGMTFGTGLHATTRACIHFLDRPAEERRSFLDAGCGSGILSIAAAKLGYLPVTSFDIDPAAVKCCRDNAERNGVQGRIEVKCTSVEDFVPGRQYDFVAVNILAPVILASAERIGELVATDGGLLALAGIRKEQFGAVTDRFLAMGFDLVEQRAEDEWLSGLLASG